MAAGAPAATPGHLERTAQDSRQVLVPEAEVIDISDASDTVKQLTLKVAEKSLAFKAGQWVDFIVPGIERVGGFSMYTSPWQLEESGTMGLAVKFSDEQPAHWVHTKCSVGAKVKLRVGGDHLVYDPQPNSPSWKLLLIAGGIGINPLYSILNQVCDFHGQRTRDAKGYSPGSVELLYSASSLKELIFRESISNIAESHTSISVKYFITKDSIGGPMAVGDNDELFERRIAASDVTGAVSRLGKEDLRCYVCGPPPMIDSMEATLYAEGIPKEAVLAEKWW